jgi:hypothetical protein
LLFYIPKVTNNKTCTRFQVILSCITLRTKLENANAVGCTSFQKNLRATSKFYASDEFHAASSTPRTQKHRRHRGRPNVRNLSTSALISVPPHKFVRPPYCQTARKRELARWKIL